MSDRLETVEPATAQATAVGVSKGRRIVALITGVVVVAVVAIGSAYVALHNEKSGGRTQRFSASQMPSVMEGAARQKLGADLGEARFAAFDSNGKPLPSGVTGGAGSMYVSFGVEGVHTWKLFVGRSDASGTSSPAGCNKVLSPSLLICDVSKAPDGGVVITSVLVAQARPDLGEGKYAPADARTLSAADLPQLRVDRNVRVFHPDGAMTSVTERIFDPRTLDVVSVFSTAVTNLADLATDPDVAELGK